MYLKEYSEFEIDHDKGVAIRIENMNRRGVPTDVSWILYPYVCGKIVVCMRSMRRVQVVL